MSWSSVWQLTSALAVCVGIVGGVTAGIQISSEPDWLDNNKVLLLLNAIYLTIVLFLVYLLSRNKEVSTFKPPNVRNIMDDGSLLTEPFSWGGIGMSVSIFLDDDGYERFLAHGEIINIQENGLYSLRTQSDDATDFVGTAKTQKNNLIIKPGQRIW